MSSTGRIVIPLTNALNMPLSVSWFTSVSNHLLLVMGMPAFDVLFLLLALTSALNPLSAEFNIIREPLRREVEANDSDKNLESFRLS